MWVSSEILNWDYYVDSFTPCNNENWKRSYEYWTHAEKLLANANVDEFSRIDIISNLKRAINHRLALLSKVYNFNQIPIKDKPIELLEQLEFYGIVRHSMLKEILDIRNALEHKFTSPPEIDMCKNYCEICWYFLRLTDNYLSGSKDSYFCEDGLSPSGMTCSSRIIFSPHKGWPLLFEIIIDKSLLFDKYNEKSINLDVDLNRDKVDSFEEFFYTNGSGKFYEDLRSGKNRLLIKGKIKGPGEMIIKIIKMYFSPFLTI